MKRSLAVAALLSFALMACGSFQYRYYGIDAQSWEGRLLARDEKDDLPLRTCEPDDQVKGKCVVMLVDEFERMRAEREELVERLKKCRN